MKVTIERDLLLKPLQAMIGVVDKRHTMPILSNILVRATGSSIHLTATDLELELVGQFAAQVEESGALAIPGRKLLDICRGLPENSWIEISSDDQFKITVKSGRSRFTLVGLPEHDFPNIDSQLGSAQVKLTQKSLLELLSKTSFAMANQDVRYFLNGLLLEATVSGNLKLVSTDGHRLAAAHCQLEVPIEQDQQVIVPRKMVMELLRLCENKETPVTLIFGRHHLRAILPELTITSKLIEGRYPDYNRVIPAKSAHPIVLVKDQFKKALNLVAILSNEKYRAVRLKFQAGILSLSANNPEQEQAEHEIEIEYAGQAFEIGFNISYLQEVLSVLPEGKVEIFLATPTSSALINPLGVDREVYVVMPIRL